MFYLGQGLKILWGHKIGLGWVLGMLGLLAVLGQYSFTQQSLDQKLAQAPYFYALVGQGHDYQGMLQKLWQLPGIGKIQVLDGQGLTDKAKGLLGHLGELADDFLAINFTGLKITFTNEAGPRSQQLIRDYMQGLMRPEELTLGPTVQQEGQRQAVWATVDWIIGCLVLVTLGCGIIFARQLQQTAYLLQQYQRRTHYAAKMLWSIWGLMLFLAASAVLTWGHPDYLRFSMAVAGGTIFVALAGRMAAWRIR